LPESHSREQRSSSCPDPKRENCRRSVYSLLDHGCCQLDAVGLRLADVFAGEARTVSGFYRCRVQPLLRRDRRHCVGAQSVLVDQWRVRMALVRYPETRGERGCDADRGEQGGPIRAQVHRCVADRRRLQSEVGASMLGARTIGAVAFAAACMIAMALQPSSARPIPRLLTITRHPGAASEIDDRAADHVLAAASRLLQTDDGPARNKDGDVRCEVALVRAGPVVTFGSSVLLDGILGSES